MPTQPTPYMPEYVASRFDRHDKLLRGECKTGGGCRIIAPEGQAAEQIIHELTSAKDLIQSGSITYNSHSPHLITFHSIGEKLGHVLDMNPLSLYPESQIDDNIAEESRPFANKRRQQGYLDTAQGKAHVTEELASRGLIFAGPALGDIIGHLKKMNCSLRVFSILIKLPGYAYLTLERVKTPKVYGRPKNGGRIYTGAGRNYHDATRGLIFGVLS